AVNNIPGRLFSSDLKLVGRERLFNGTWEHLEDLTKDTQLSVELFSNSGFDYKPMAMAVPQMSICTAIQTYYGRFIKNSVRTGIDTDFDFQDGNVCPVPKGKYYLKNMSFDMAGWVSFLPRGLIKTKINYMDNDGFGGGVEFIVEIKDRPI
ncbi:hypothetical protein KR018_004937, partial [Drosophila ironensis]